MINCQRQPHLSSVGRRVWSRLVTAQVPQLVPISPKWAAAQASASDGDLLTDQPLSNQIPASALSQPISADEKNTKFRPLRSACDRLMTSLPACDQCGKEEKTNVGRHKCCWKQHQRPWMEGRSLTWYFLCLGSSRCKQEGKCAQCSQRPRAKRTGFY